MSLKTRADQFSEWKLRQQPTAILQKPQLCYTFRVARN